MSTQHPLVQLVIFRAREFARQPEVIFWAFIFPLVMAAVLGLAFRPKAPDPLPVLVTDGASAAAAALASSTDLRVIPRPPVEAARSLARGEAALLVVPGDPPVLRYDDTHPDARATRLAVEAALARASGAPPPPARHETETASGARYIDWLVPGILGLQVMNGCLWGVGFALVEMRAKKLLKRFAVTPMRRSHFLLAQAIHRAVVITVEALLLIGFARLAFGVLVLGSPAALALLTLVGTLAFAGIGLLVASRARNTEVAAGLMNIPMLPQMVVSGVFFASSRFPDWLQPAIQALPLTALVSGLRRVTNEGADVAGVAAELGVLAAWGLITLVLALRIFRWA